MEADMQRILVTLGLMLALAAPAAAQSKFEKRWNEKVAGYRSQNRSIDLAERRIVLFGSSSTEGWRYSKRVARFLPHIKSRVLNRGISGDGIGLRKTTGLYHRIKSSVIDAKPSHVFVLNGRNSVGGYGVKRTAQRYREVLRAIRRALPKAVVCVITCAPVRGKYTRIKDKTAQLNARLRVISKEEGCWLIDLEPKLQDSSGLLKADLTNDGLHFKDGGYRILGAEIERVVRQSEGAKAGTKNKAGTQAQPSGSVREAESVQETSPRTRRSKTQCPGLAQKLLGS
jgi:lysophospholipase L1-like esterase